MSDHHLAQLNIGLLRAPLDSPAMAGFVALLDPINALADTSPGFVWRLRGEGADDATGVRVFGEEILVNLSVWETYEALWNFTYRSDHLEAVRRRREWFTRMREAFLVLWWVPAGHVPDVEEARDRLALFRERGASPAAFSFRDPMPAPSAAPRA
ncbi:DUF3291 domain-containing protein [Marinactinospora thermotolerans]|uniref:DUF3291 domain-containing protein n=1 Tax=Marinactinospora thermotolerans TaxID=531310 RepID=UPI003D94F733